MIAPDLPTLNALFSAEAAPPDAAISVPNGTKGRMLERRFLRGSRLVDPYPASENDMERDGALEVAMFEITEGPQRGLKGWIQLSFLAPDYWYI
jgi:hypothetical protein